MCGIYLILMYCKQREIVYTFIFKFPIRNFFVDYSCKSFIIGCFDLGESNVVNFIDTCADKYHLVGTKF